MEVNTRPKSRGCPARGGPRDDASVILPWLPIHTLAGTHQAPPRADEAVAARASLPTSRPARC